MHQELSSDARVWTRTGTLLNPTEALLFSLLFTRSRGPPQNWTREGDVGLAVHGVKVLEREVPAMQVLCRVRSEKKEEGAQPPVVEVLLGGAKTRVKATEEDSIPHMDFNLDAAFGPDATQADLFKETIPLVDHFLQGGNASVLAYGQTGSGKAHTVFGDDDNDALTSLTMRRVFATIAKKKRQGHPIKVVVSILSLCKEKFSDLVATAEEAKAVTTLRIQQRSPAAGDLHIPLAKEVEVHSMEDVKKLLRTAESNFSLVRRTTHCKLFRVRLESSGASAVDVEQASDNRNCQLSLVVLPASERPNQDPRLEGALDEGLVSVNVTLSSLGSVLGILAKYSRKEIEKKAKMFVPYRNSNLTRLLQNTMQRESEDPELPSNEEEEHLKLASSLQAESIASMKRQLRGKTLLICCLDPRPENRDETISSLRFAQRASRLPKS